MCSCLNQNVVLTLTWLFTVLGMKRKLKGRTFSLPPGHLSSLAPAILLPAPITALQSPHLLGWSPFSWNPLNVWDLGPAHPAGSTCVQPQAQTEHGHCGRSPPWWTELGRRPPLAPEVEPGFWAGMPAWVPRAHEDVSSGLTCPFGLPRIPVPTELGGGQRCGYTEVWRWTGLRRGLAEPGAKGGPASALPEHQAQMSLPRPWAT